MIKEASLKYFDCLSEYSFTGLHIHLCLCDIAFGILHSIFVGDKNSQARIVRKKTLHMIALIIGLYNINQFFLGI